MPLSVAESPVCSVLPAVILLWLLLMVLPVAPAGAQERQADAPAATDALTAGDDGTQDAAAADTAASGEPDKAAAQGAAGEGWHLATGLALGTFVIPVESDLTAEALAPALYVDLDLSPWLGLRLGINAAEMKLDELTLQTTTIYLAYRHAFQVTGNWWGELYAGVASADSVLSGERAELTASGSGHVLGASAWYRLRRFDLGLRYELLSTDSAFSGISVNTGSNQVQLTAAYRWF